MVFITGTFFLIAATGGVGAITAVMDSAFGGRMPRGAHERKRRESIVGPDDRRLCHTKRQQAQESTSSCGGEDRRSSKDRSSQLFGVPFGMRLVRTALTEVAMPLLDRMATRRPRRLRAAPGVIHFRQGHPTLPGSVTARDPAATATFIPWPAATATTDDSRCRTPLLDQDRLSRPAVADYGSGRRLGFGEPPNYHGPQGYRTFERPVSPQLGDPALRGARAAL